MLARLWRWFGGRWPKRRRLPDLLMEVLGSQDRVNQATLRALERLEERVEALEPTPPSSKTGDPSSRSTDGQ